MKCRILILFLAVGLQLAAQDNMLLDFFDQFGAVDLETTEMSEAKDEMINVFHRRDDIVWSKIIYRIIDMRYKQNYQLYFPTQCDDPNHRSLFKVIVDAVVDGGMPIYEKLVDNPRPDFSAPLEKKNIPSLFLVDDPKVDYSNDSSHYDIETSDAMLVLYDRKRNRLKFNFYPYEGFVKNQLKYLVQEVVFFDKHFSRLYSKIIAIAPMQSDRITTTDPTQLTEALMQSVLFWCSYDKLRPFLSQQYCLTSENDSKRITFEEFFLKRMYSSYILGEDNVHNRVITDYARSRSEIVKEQDRIDEALMTFEQDLWEY